MITWKTYRKKPVLVDAFRFWKSILTPETVGELEDMGISVRTWPQNGDDYLIIANLNSESIVREGDWVLSAIDDEYYRCSDKDFREMYQGAWPP